MSRLQNSPLASSSPVILTQAETPRFSFFGAASNRVAQLILSYRASFQKSGQCAISSGTATCGFQGAVFAYANREATSLPRYLATVAVPLAHCSTLPGALASLR